MGKNKRKELIRRPSNGPAAVATPVPAAVLSLAPASANPEEAIQQATNVALERATEEDLAQLADPDHVVPVGTNVPELVQKASAVIVVLEAQKVRFDKQLEALEKEKEALKKREDGVHKRTAELDALVLTLKDEKSGLAAERRAISKRDEELNERESHVKELELQAEAGFADRFRQWLGGFEEQRSALHTEIDALRKRIVEERQAWERERGRAYDELQTECEKARKENHERLAAMRDQADIEIQQHRKQLLEEHAALALAKSRIRSEQAALAAEKEILAENQARQDMRVERLSASRVEQLNQLVFERDEQLAVARADRDRLSRRLVLREEADRQFGNRTPEEVMESLRILKQERDELQTRLAVVPGADTIERLRKLEEASEQAQTERIRLLEENRSLKSQLARTQIAVTEIESLRDQKAALESSRDLLEAALKELRSDVEERIRRSDGRCPFPTSAAMDTNDDLQTGVPTKDSLPNLEAFIEDLRHRIADDSVTGKSLFYSKRDLRCFVGGMAMSRMHLLQGISGTGKTSLPVAFARAIGAGVKIIEIQAGWRDRQDLVGHYNAFERKFYESEFLLALYRAGCPRFRSTPYIIVLDEMNLSHPEQYFAEFLSKLEQDQHLQKLELTTEAVEPAPSLFEQGRLLPLPPNVWFVGTANHDETTKDFAPKTYDRAHVMELPRHPGAFDVKPWRDQDALSMAALTNAFDSARRRFGDSVGKAYEFLDQHLGDTLQKRFGVGWGNRLERQLTNYVPVIRASGGHLGEALDHIIATKLIRNIRNRHDNRPEHIKELLDEVSGGLQLIDPAWMRTITDESEIASVTMLREEYDKLGGDIIE